MSSVQNPHDFGDKRYNNGQNTQNYRYGRNRTFSSTTSDHYKKKLADIGIEKDLREILERKRIQKEKEKAVPSSSSQYSSISPRKVRFKEDTTPIRRSKSFTSGTYNTIESSPEPEKKPEEISSNFSRTNSYNYKGKRNYVDLQHPTNIKVELKIESGQRQCTVDSDVPISGIKCDLRNSRNILKHVHSQENRKELQTDHSERVGLFGNSRGRGRRYFDKKNGGNGQKYFIKDNENNVLNSTVVVDKVEEALSNLSIVE